MIDFDNIPRYADHELFTVCRTCHDVGLLVASHNMKLGDKSFTTGCQCGKHTDYKVVDLTTAKEISHKIAGIRDLAGFPPTCS